MDAHTQFGCLLDHLAQHRRRHGIGGVRAEHRGDARVPFVAEGAHALDRSRQQLRAVGRHANNHAGEVGADAALAHRPRHRLHMPVHVAERRHPGAQHLGDAQQRRPVDILLGEMRLHWPDLLPQPGHQRQIIRRPAKERHRQVRVRVNEPGNRDHARAVNDGSVVLRRRRLRYRPDVDNPLPRHDNRRAMQHALLIVHGDDGDVMDMNIRHNSPQSVSWAGERPREPTPGGNLIRRAYAIASLSNTIFYHFHPESAREDARPPIINTPHISTPPR
ncbi:MAG: hypothetical protein BWY76_03276 [bacterium ADurb.Bin429]|nr:MAG: hypothetical protein BWY76_03276 [bacterium ADurb.Bin429]